MSASQAPSAPQEPPASIAPVDASVVGGVTPVSFEAPEGKVSAQAFRFDGARNLSTAVDVVRGRMLRQATWDKADSTAVTARITAAGADVVGVEMTSSMTKGAAKTAVSSAIWYDALAQQSYASAALIDEKGWAGFVSAVEAAAGEAGLDAAAAAAALAEQAAPYGRGPAVGFAADGALVVTFGSGVLGDEPASLTVRAETAAPLLSPLGTRAAAAVAAPAPLAPAPTNAPAPTSAPASASASPSAAPGGQGTRAPLTIGPDCMVLDCVALTFDDGPGPRSNEVQDALAAGKAGATFYLLGENAETYAPTVARAMATGMEVANHSMKHPDLARQSPERVTKEIAGTNEVLRKITGETPLTMRPPYGSHDKAVEKVAADNSLAIVQWSVDTLDWKTRNTASTIATATSLDGYSMPIVLMHDIHDSTVDAVAQIVSDLTAAGYTLVTVSEQSLNQGGMRAGHAYCHGTGVEQEGFNCKG